MSKWKLSRVQACMVEAVLSEITFSRPRCDFVWNLHDLRPFCERLHRRRGSAFYEFTYVWSSFLRFFFYCCLFILFFYYYWPKHSWHSRDPNQNTIHIMNVTRFIEHESARKPYWEYHISRTVNGRKYRCLFCFAGNHRGGDSSMTNRMS